MDTEEIKSIIENEIIRRKARESKAGVEANKLISKFIKKREKAKAKTATNEKSEP